MRITGGNARGIEIFVPKKGEIRPATDAIREAVFSSLGELVENSRVLDAFAGTGAYALEALSRGANFAILADKNSAAISAQKKNFEAVAKSLKSRGNAVPEAKFRAVDLLKNSPFPSSFPKFDLIFCDPPWRLWSEEKTANFVEILASLFDEKTPWARLILETPAEFFPAVPAGWEVAKRISKKGKDQSAASIFIWIS